MKQDFALIHGAADKMGRLLGELLELSRIGRLINEPEAVPLTTLAHEALDTLAGLLEPGQVAVTIESTMPTVYVDRNRLFEVYQNLIETATPSIAPDRRNPTWKTKTTNDSIE